jgi:hypothetical protein
MKTQVAGSEHWVHGTYRLLHLDAHFRRFKDIYSDFDAEATAQTYADAGFQMVSYMAMDGPSYYPTKVGTMHPGLKRDFVGEFTAALKKRAIKAIVYVHLGGLAWDTEALGKGIAQLLELLDLYNVDGFFLDVTSQPFLKAEMFSEKTQALFEGEVGAEFPSGDDDPGAFEFRRWVNRRHDDFLQRIIDAVLEVKPDALLICNGSWMLRYPKVPPKAIHMIQWDVATPQNEGVYGCSCSLEGRYLSTMEDRSFSMHNVRGRDWIEYSLREPEAFLHESAVLLAGCGKPYLSDNPYPSGNPDPALTRIYRDVNQRTRELEPYLENARPVKDVAVLHSADSVWSKAPFAPVTGWMPSPAYHPVAGAHKALVEGHVQVLIPNSETLIETLDEYKALILADQRILSSEEAAAVRSFVEGGGALIATCETGTRDQRNNALPNFALADVLGVDYVETSDTSLGYLRVGEEHATDSIPVTDVPAVGTFVRVKPNGAETLMDLAGPYEGVKTGYPPPSPVADGPGITVHRYGNGVALYCAVRVFDAYYKEDIPLLRKLALWMLDRVHPPEGRTVSLSNAPINVEVFHNLRDADSFVHLVNFSADKREGHAPMVQDFWPISGIDVHVRTEAKPRDVVLVPGEKSIDFAFESGIVSFVADPLLIHSVYWVRQEG